jgi:uncharacterized protein
VPNLPLGLPSEKSFYNREQELKRLKNYLNALNIDIAEEILVTGYRGVGKTSLLKKLMKELPENILVTYVDISRIYGSQKGEITEEAILINLLNAMNDALGKRNSSITNKIYSTVKNALKKISMKEYDFKNAGAILGIAIPDVKDSYRKLSQFVMEFPQKVVESSKGELKGFIIIIDEFQLMNGLKNPHAFFWMIRGYAQEQHNVSYIFTGSTSKTSEVVEMMNGPNGAFGGRMIQFNVDPFTEEEVKGYLDDKLPEIKFTDDGFQRFYECTRGIPAYINTFGNTMSASDVYDSENVKKTFFNKLDQITVMWIKIWGGLSDWEKELLISLVEKGPQTWSELLEKVDFTRGTLAKYLDVLKNKGIISSDKKRYAIDDHLLEVWIKNKKISDGYYPP